MHLFSCGCMRSRDRSLPGGQYILKILYCFSFIMMLTPWISAWLFVLTVNLCAGIMFFTRMATPAFALPSLSCRNTWWPLKVKRGSLLGGFPEGRPHRCFFCGASLWGRSSYKPLLHFHCRMLMPFDDGVSLWSVSLTLASRLLAWQDEVRWPPVAEGGPLWGEGPGTLPPWRIPGGWAPYRDNKLALSIRMRNEVRNAVLGHQVVLHFGLRLKALIGGPSPRLNACQG